MSDLLKGLDKRMENPVLTNAIEMMDVIEDDETVAMLEAMGTEEYIPEDDSLSGMLDTAEGKADNELETDLTDEDIAIILSGVEDDDDEDALESALEGDDADDEDEDEFVDDDELGDDDGTGVLESLLDIALEAESEEDDEIPEIDDEPATEEDDEPALTEDDDDADEDDEPAIEADDSDESEEDDSDIDAALAAIDDMD